jgi:hypothetical protein
MGKSCLAEVYQKLGRQADAEAMLRDIPQALHWLEIALHQRDSELSERFLQWAPESPIFSLR